MAEETKVEVSIEASQKTGAIEAAGRAVGEFQGNIDELTAATRANAEQLGLLNARQDEATEKSKAAAEAKKQQEAAANTLGGQIDKLKDSIGGLITAGALGAFFKEAVEESVKEAEALRQLQFAVESTGGSWAILRGEVEAYAAAQQANTRFEDTVTYETLGRLLRVTGDLGQAIAATTLAQNIAAASGKDLASTTELIANLTLGQERAVIQARKELGAYVGTATDAQGALDNLKKGFEGAAAAEESWTKTTGQARATVGDFMQRIGDGAVPVLDKLIGLLMTVPKWTEKIAESFATAGAAVYESINGYGQAAAFALTGHFSEAARIARRTTEDLKIIFTEGAAGLAEIDARYSGQRVATAVNTERVIAKETAQAAAERAEKLEEARKKEAKIVADAEAEAVRQVEAQAELNDQLVKNYLESTEQKYEIQRQAVEREIAEAEAAGIQTIEFQQNGTTQEISLAEYRAARLSDIERAHAANVVSENKKILAEKKKLEDETKKLEDDRKRNFASTLQFISTLQSSKNKDLLFVGKAAASANVIVSTAEGVAKAFALGPILGPIMAPIVALAGAAQLATIAGVQLEKGGVTDGTGQQGILANIGERGRKEGVIPLEDPRAMREIGQAIAKAGGLGGGQGGATINNFYNTFALPGLEAARDPAVARAILEILAEQMANPGPEEIRFARRTAEVNELNAGRSS